VPPSIFFISFYLHFIIEALKSLSILPSIPYVSYFCNDLSVSSLALNPVTKVVEG